MLPKLRTLNKAAKEQSLVYCLATNYLNEVDPAAKREERFDVHMPIYHPDPVSRFEVFLYRLICLAQRGNKEQWGQDLNLRMEQSDFFTRVGHTVSQTRYVSAQSLAVDFFKVTSKDPKKDETLLGYVQRVLPNSFFRYVLDENFNDCPDPSKELVGVDADSRDNFKNETGTKTEPSGKNKRYVPAPVETDITKNLIEFEKSWPVFNRAS